MMTQSELVKLAKQGNPQAIAALMNLALESKGVTAKAAVKEDCLHICFSSEQLLSQKTLLGFVQNGLSALGALSFQQVKVYAQKLGQEMPVWSESLTFNSKTAVASPEKSQPAKPQVARNQSANAEPDLPSFRTAVAEGVPQTTASQAAAVPAVAQAAVMQTTAAQAAVAQAAVIENAVMAASPGANVSPSARALKRPPSRTKAGAKRQKPWQKFVRQLSQKFPLSNKYVLASAIAGSAFLFGGIIALVTTSLTGTAQNGQNSSNAMASNNQLTQLSSGSQPNEITAYLAKINKAQQAFHQTNGRFSTNLEELEKSASIISRSTNYDFKLVLRDQFQSLLTAIPKSKDSKSYSGAILMNQANPSTATASNIVCATNQPSIFPPVIPQSTTGTLQCPGDSTQVPN